MNDHDLNEANTDTPEERRTVVVACTHPGGLTLRLYKPHHHKAHADTPMPRPDVSAVTLTNGHNVVDEEFWNSYVEENPGNDLVNGGIITLVKPPAEEDAEDETGD